MKTAATAPIISQTTRRERRCDSGDGRNGDRDPLPSCMGGGGGGGVLSATTLRLVVRGPDVASATMRPQRSILNQWRDSLLVQIAWTLILYGLAVNADFCPVDN